MPYKDPEKRRKVHRLGQRRRRGSNLALGTGSMLYRASDRLIELIATADHDDLMFEWKRINNAFDQRFAKNQSH
jgi:hypothetical protein